MVENDKIKQLFVSIIYYFQVCVTDHRNKYDDLICFLRKKQNKDIAKF